MVDEGILKQMIERAKANLSKAYAPYSNYHVGVALLAKNGAIYDGANIENCVHRATHAERLALDNAVLAGEREFLTLVVVTDDEKAPFPCGQCRQDLAEFDKDGAGRLEIIAVNLKGYMERSTLDELLPKRFGPANF